MDSNIVFLCCVCGLFVSAVRVLAISHHTDITFNNNSYTGLLVAIRPDVPQDMRLVDFIKNMFTDASAYLYSATAERAYFGEVIILVPNTWTDAQDLSPATSQLLNNADVIIRDRKASRNVTGSNSSLVDKTGAYTQTYGRCGQAGVRINIFTDIFGPDGRVAYGPAGRLLVHEWAHFRWGVFDEHSEEGGPQFYFSPSTHQLEAVRCNINMAGTINRVDPVSGLIEKCVSVNPKTGTYDHSCHFTPDLSGHVNDNITASIMDRQDIPSITNFCNDDTFDPSRVHNYESPSLHNRLCSGRSVWSVISQNEDFQKERNRARYIPDTTPKFKVVKMRSKRRMVLAIDTSASMQAHNKLTRAVQAATYFIEDGLEDGVSIGVVTFSGVARVVSPITELTNEGSRKTISRNLPTKCEGETSIAAALLTSIELLKRHNESTSDAFIVLITDGHETTTPTVDEVVERVVGFGAVVSVIAFQDDEERFLEQLATRTGGRYYFDTRQEMATSAVGAMLDMYSFFDSGKGQLPVQILGQAKGLEHLKSMSGKFALDASLGRKTVMIVTYTADDPPDVTVISPSGRRYCSLYPEYSSDPLLKRVKITIPALAEIGVWSYAVTNTNDQGLPIVVSLVVLSSGRDPRTPTLSFTGDIFLENGSWPIRAVIVAEVTRGILPAKELRVKAAINRPMASTETLELFDNGSGADAVKGDGIYSRFFTKFSTSGHYSVNIKMLDAHGDAIVEGDMESGPSQIATGYASSIHIDHPKPSYPATPSSVLVDDYPPMRITDLRVLHTSSSNFTVVLGWTAPGDDLDDDRASYYTIVTSSSAEAIVKNEDLPTLDPGCVTKGDLNSPKPFGQKEEVELTLKIPSGTKTGVVFAIFAVDDSGNKGELSNLVTVGFGYVPDVSTHEYLQEVRHSRPKDMKAAPRSQKIVIACVVGLAAGLLVVTVVVTSLLQSASIRSKEKALLQHFYKIKNQIV